MHAYAAEGATRVDGQDRIDFLVQTRNAAIAPMLQVGGPCQRLPFVALRASPLALSILHGDVARALVPVYICQLTDK